VVIAKSIAMGLPLSGVLGKQVIMDAAAPGAVGGTYVGNPVAQAAALAVLDVIEEDGLVERSGVIGETIRARMLAWQERWFQIGDVRGLGSMLAIELIAERTTAEPAPELAAAVVSAALSRGLMLITCGTYGNCIRVLAPLVITEAELDEALGVWDEALEAVLG
jgi:4-aminobutyrate aminotransferase/(S)-3-amino-2-methylpropionate transaminase